MKGPIPNYLKYGFKTTEVAEMYQKEYVPEIEEYIQTSDLPGVTIKVDRCSYTEYNKAYGVPVYQLDFTYSSHKLMIIMNQLLILNVVQKTYSIRY